MRNLLILFVGESNSGGFASNDSALIEEKGLRNSINLLNNETLTLQKLNINRRSAGGNNLLGHAGLDPDGNTHGWELQLANRADQGAFGSDIVHLLKGGQGSSSASQWDAEDDSYQITFKQRSDAIKSLVDNIIPIIWISLGINDSLLSTPNEGEIFRIQYTNAINIWRNRWPTAPVLISTVTPKYTVQNANIRTLQSTIANSYLIDADTVATTTDDNHWSYGGLKIISNKFIDKTIELFPRPLISNCLANGYTIFKKDDL